MTDTQTPRVYEWDEQPRKGSLFPWKISRFAKWFWGIAGGLFLLVVILFWLIAAGFFGSMPTFEEIENPQSRVATEIWSADGELLGTFFVENRSYITYEDLSPAIVDALVSTEDSRFYGHSGIDALGLGRVFFKTILLNQAESGGGSTISQQLAKNLFPRDTLVSRNALVRGAKFAITKFKEWITAVRLERNYSKQEILAMYLNTVPFGSNAYGIRMASRTFFNSTPDTLKVEEAALLIGMLKAPTRYSPIRNPERALSRRNTVMSKMVDNGRLTQAQYDSISQLPIELRYQQQDHNTGLATYVREHIRILLTAREPRPGLYFSHDQYQADSLEWANNPLYGWCAKNVKPDGSEYNIYTGGLKIYTTIDSRMQRYAEEAVREHLGGTLQRQFDREHGKRLFIGNVPDSARRIVLTSGMHSSQRYKRLRDEGATEKEIEKVFKEPIPMRIFSWKGDIDTVLSPYDSMIYYKKLLRAGFVAMEPGTGYVRAYVGGNDFAHFKYDQVYRGRRQVGSTIKPFLYALAMQEGMSPCMRVPNVPQVFNMGDTIWSPKNSDVTKRDGQLVTLRWGLANSVNNISAWLIKQFTPEAVVALIHTMGITSYVDPEPSIFLGVSDFSLYEMAAAYAAFAANGVRADPLIVTSIKDRNGNILDEFAPRRQEVISPETAYKMVELLKSVVYGGGGSRMRYLYNVEGPIGGKTGTTQNSSDGWFMCIHPKLSMGAWVGNEDRAVHFGTLLYGQGAHMALPIVAKFMQRVYANPAVGVEVDDKWRVPESLRGVNFYCPDNDTVSASNSEAEFF